MGSESRLAGRCEMRWMTIPEAAEYTRTDPDWILEQIKAGLLKYVPTARRSSLDPSARGPRRRIVDRLKLDALMERLEVIETPPPAPEASADAVSAPAARTRPALPRRGRVVSGAPGMSSREMYERGL